MMKMLMDNLPVVMAFVGGMVVEFVVGKYLVSPAAKVVAMVSAVPAAVAAVVAAAPKA